MIPHNIVQAVDFKFAKRVRGRHYSDDEVRAIWAAAGQLEPIAGAYVKLLILLAPRKTALACMRRTDLVEPDRNGNPTIWVTPFELTKSRKTVAKQRVYRTPLPPLAQRILKSVPRSNSDRLFTTVPVYPNLKTGQPHLHDRDLKKALIKHGAPQDLHFHAVRHTLATWLQDEEKDGEWAAALVLNHAGSGVAANYLHGHALKLKLELLTKWADHVEKLVRPAENITVYR